MLHRVLGENVALAVVVHASAVVYADPSQLEIALLNLALNARDAMPRGGQLTVEVGRLAPDDPARPAGEDVPAGPLAVLLVRDTGVGMDPATRARMFEPFFTTKGVGRGTGLGLPIVLGVVGECGGAIRVETGAGSGTEFRLYFPIRTGEAGTAATREADAAPRGTETVLVVEDDPHLRGVIRRALASHGYAVRAVGNAADARAVVGSAPDLLLTDVVLPDGNGLDLAAELAVRWPGAKILFMSGYTGDHLRAVGDLPADALLLPKPFTAGTLLVRIREVLERRRSVA